MKSEQKYIKDITEIRSMMERSTKFLSLTGLSGIMAGVYALIGTYLADRFFYNEEIIYYTKGRQELAGDFFSLFLLGLVVLVLAIGTAVFLSSKKAKKNDEKLWNSAARRLLLNMAIPLFTGGIFIFILFSKGIMGLIIPATLLFYGLSLLNASKFTFEDFKYLGIIEIVLGLLASNFNEYALWFWAVGFGVMHIAYGIYMHLKYEK